MGKFYKESHGLGENGDPTTTNSSSSIIFYDGCCPTCIARFAPYFTHKCLLVLILSFSVFLYALFLLTPSRPVHSGFDASQTVKLTASIQAYFRLKKTVSELVPRIRQLEDELYREIGVPDTKVTIISMHKSHIPNSTYVVFGFLPNPKAVPINSVSLSVLKSSLVELFLQEANMTLTSSTFGDPSSFEIIKFSSSITVTPRQPAPVSQIVQTLFNFTLNNSIYDVKVNLDLLTKQLKTGLHLRFDENVYVQVTNKVGSTMDRPVIVQASVLSKTGSLQPHRLKQLAQTLKNSSSKNLGLNNTMFGRVKSVSLSSYLSHTLEPGPSPSPSPSPSLPPCFAYSPHTSAPPSSNNHLSPCPSPTGNLHQRPISRSHLPSIQAPKPSSRPNCASKGASPPSQYHWDSSAGPDLSPHAVSKGFHPFPFEHYIFMQGQEKISGVSLMPHKTLSSGTYYLGIHLLVSSIVASHLLYWLF